MKDINIVIEICGSAGEGTISAGEILSRFMSGQGFEIMSFEKQTRIFDLSEYKLNRTNEDLFKSHYLMLNIEQLNHSIDSLSNQRINRLKIYKERFIKRNPYIAKLDTMTVEAEKIIPDSSETESLDKHESYNLKYPLLSNFKNDIRHQIIDNALKTSRSTKENIIFFRDEQKMRKQVITKHKVVWHQKFTLSVACLIFFFIGAPLGAIIRKGGLGLPVVVSVLFFVLYYIVSMTSENAAKSGTLNPDYAIWLSTLIILPLGLFLTYKATSDAQLLDTESWKKFFERFKLNKEKVNE